MERFFTHTFYIQGTLAANHTQAFKLPCDVQLVYASASNTTANAGTLKVGNSTDDDAYLTVMNFGVSGAVTEAKTPAAFAGVDAAGQFPHIPAGTIILLTITDHASHMAAASVVLGFTEG